MWSSLALTVTLLPAILALPNKGSTVAPQDNLLTTGESTARNTRTHACPGNTASDRSVWCDYDVSTDYTEIVPDTGVTREYWLELTNVTVAPDGVPRTAQAINGTIPGPTLFADWGDTVIVHVTNSLTGTTNGTSMHWHGIRQLNTNQEDGVASITQCPTAIGESYTYKWRATQYGSSWYHSHFSLQTWEGAFGGIVINGPATADYDEDLGVLFLNDWDHKTVDELYDQAQTEGSLTLDNGLINGTNVWTEGGRTTGSRYSVRFAPGTSYRIRLVNSAIDTHWKWSIDGHTMTVIAMDLVPIEPYTTNVLSIGIGQRYDVIITADQASTASAFWMRAIPQAACSKNANADNIRGIVYYGDAVSMPTTSAYAYTDGCEDERMSDLVPHVRKDATSSPSYEAVDMVDGERDANNTLKWYLNSTTFRSDWADPTLLQVYDGARNFSASEAVVQLDAAGEWAVMVVETDMDVPHPIHMHGYDVFVLAQGTGSYSADTVALKTSNPPRRDTAMLPAGGYLVVGFRADNPGAWLMHCHVGWHASEGFSMQWLVQQDRIRDLVDGAVLKDTCASWSKYAEEHRVEQDDSGI